ncbi:DUF6036 family nucleotidyltransferase [Pyrobaculum aerophilum]|uniref:DUF6036 domain-containing protein n=1 Tax=Pyrobaculum aerophilum TaxID=13773 RepID=A0A371R5F3_9CREN|nr:DUF6036 family nucleotidyltransferase [Pyrobaculum aerophilum]RFA98266.1 hypothetical protein CGL51_00855 [Pyrobaculum aerophilum]RFA99293.1 hypothetical protein CGL52_03690 [Pyrobaculum aerophilum]
MRQVLPPSVKQVVEICKSLGFKVFLIGARALQFYGLYRQTGDWDFVIDKPFTAEVRDSLTAALRNAGYLVQWRKWGLYIDAGGVHVDINYAPLILDDEFIARSREVSGIYIPSPEDLVILKLASGERKDIDDLKKLLRLPLDLEYLKKRAVQSGLERELRKMWKRVHGSDI